MTNFTDSLRRSFDAFKKNPDELYNGPLSESEQILLKGKPRVQRWFGRHFKEEKELPPEMQKGEIVESKINKMP